MPADHCDVAAEQSVANAGEDPGGLPQELLVKVLQHVPQKFRLGRCPPVCLTWRDAAAAASSSAQLGFVTTVSSTKLDSLMRWLNSRGQHVSSLSLSNAGTAAAPFHPGLLPCRQLQRLTLCKCHLQLTGQSLSRLTSLTRLDLGPGLGSGSSAAAAKLSSNSFDGFPDCLLALTQLTGLQHLHITRMTAVERVMQRDPPFPAGLVSHLAHLTHLDIGGFAVTAAAMRHLTRLSDLQNLDFGDIDSDDETFGAGPGYWIWEGAEEYECVMPADALADLSGLQDLTSLRVPAADCVLGSHITPGFSTLTALRSLELRSGRGLEPSSLSDMTALQALTLWATPLRGSGTQGLLSVLPQLQQLTELCLFASRWDSGPLPAPPADQYSALVSSSKLVKLKLTGPSASFPQEAWCAMFDGRRQLPALRSIVMDTWMYRRDCSLRAQDLRSLALSCPGLQELIVQGSVDPALLAADLSVLQPLQQLGTLVISNHVSDDIAVGLAPKVTSGLKLLQLQRLQVFNSGVWVWLLLLLLPLTLYLLGY